jgi:acyl-CoA thioester hydrolase
MGATFTDHIRVRAYECDAYEHVNNTVYLQYLQQVTLDAMGTTNDGAAFWNVRRLAIEYQAPARYGDVLQIATWVSEADESRVVRGYHVTRGAGRIPVLRAQIEWDYRDRAAGGLRRVPEVHRVVPTVDAPAPPKPFVTPHDNGARPFRWRHTVPFYELDSTNRVGPAIYLQWLEAAFFHATGSAGWTLAKMHAENLFSLQYRHDAEFFDAAVNGDEIEIRSRLIEFRRVRGTWLHEVYRATTNTLIMRDYSVGAFLDWDGNVRAGPLEVLEKLTHGEAPEAT